MVYLGEENWSIIIDFMRFHGFCKKEISLSWYVLSNYSKNADSWINGWIVSRLLRLLAGIANSFSDDNDSILLRGNYGNQTIIICTMESIIRFIKQFIPYDSFCLLIKMKRSCSVVGGNLSKVNFCLLLCDKYFGARRARLSWGITIQWRIIIPPPLC